MKFVCLDCLTEPYLREKMGAQPLESPCGYCGGSQPTVDLDQVAAQCDMVLKDCYKPVGEFRLRHGGTNSKWLKLPEVLKKLGVVGPSVLSDLVDQVKLHWNSPLTGESRYKGPGTDRRDPYFEEREDFSEKYGGEWSKMEDSLKYRNRAFNSTAQIYFDEVFGGIHSEMTSAGQPVVVEAGPGHVLQGWYRARMFQDLRALDEAMRSPSSSLGTRPPGVGTAGRMNFEGQPVFYGATTEDVALAEVRPPVGSWVVVGKFILVRPVKLLDIRKLTDLKEVGAGSLFDPKYRRGRSRADFLGELVDHLTQPVMPETQHRDYLITQVLADYLASHPKGSIDGVIFPSTQMPPQSTEDEFNVALFPQASRVRGDGAKHTHQVVRDFAGRRDFPRFGDYEGYIMMIEETESSALADDDGSGLNREDALALDTFSLRIHQVTGIQISTLPRGVGYL